jgi:hypothetical protein
MSSHFIHCHNFKYLFFIGMWTLCPDFNFHLISCSPYSIACWSFFL